MTEKDLRVSSFEELLAEDGSFVWKTVGRSMRPLIRQGKDLVVISRPEGRLSRFDVAFYNSGEKHLLHRVLQVCDGYYIIAGDNNTFLEKVSDDQVIGVMTALKRGGRDFDLKSGSYRFYERNYCGRFRLKCVILKPLHFFRAALSAVYHKIKRK
ncbi:MAG: S24/S26 family peptidase [Clostridia bacterium]|nr:S24/S26 family peptidase [Clostridia bacterium]